MRRLLCCRCSRKKGELEKEEPDDPAPPLVQRSYRDLPSEKYRNLRSAPCRSDANSYTRCSQ